ncbi:hypothetical protein [Polaromonas naphthalenivorans]|uniref:hypothetical protein n=1 Tax=Polaromonas naphthalenivorans TaxID=216465 RepID=UPI00059E3486|nr:hypothetical protein [Polaromonas naphthalenivorans]
MKYQFIFAALLLSSLTAQAGDEENSVILVSEQESGPQPHESHFRKAFNPRQGEGLYTRPDGTCIFRTVFDNGYTHVTIDGKGTLFAQKNDVVEDVQVPCP